MQDMSDIFQVMILTSVFIYFKKYSDSEQSPAYPSEKLVETVGTFHNSTGDYDGSSD
jgi:hypothetical protein